MTAVAHKYVIDIRDLSKWRTCVRARVRQWRRAPVPCPRWCYNCDEVDINQTPETDRAYCMARSTANRCCNCKRNIIITGHPILSNLINNIYSLLAWRWGLETYSVLANSLQILSLRYARWCALDKHFYSLEFRRFGYDNLWQKTSQ